MFAEVSSEESARLHNLIKDLKTEMDVIKAFGEPTHVLDPGARCTDPEKDGKPGEIHTYKTMRYEALSETAVVDANIDRRGNASISLFGKYIGKPQKT
jgi:hypothetical protein